MNLFFKKLTGGLQSTEKMERRIMDDEKRIARYRQVEQSADLKEYLELKKIVESKEFQQKKFNLTHTKYKNTPVYATISAYKKLRDDKEFQTYLETEKSQELKEYLAFRNSENYIKLQSASEVRNSLELKRMAEFEKSKRYKSYLKIRDSKMPEQYKKLSAEVATEEFKEQLAFWKNDERWSSTEEYRQEARYKALSKKGDIIFFMKQDPKEIERMEKLHATFMDECDWLKLSESQWRPGFAYNNPKLPRMHSFANEKQANNGGKNVGTLDGKIQLFTKQEKVTAPAWDPKKGFINKDFEYTSDIIQTADSFRQKEGVFMAKIRIEGNIHHAFWLGSGERLPIISIFHFNGKQITVGNYTKNGFDGTVVKGISPRLYYIYSLKWTERELIWLVNNVEVHRTSRNIPDEKLFLALSSFIDENQRGSEGLLSVAWVRVYEEV